MTLINYKIYGKKSSDFQSVLDINTILPLSYRYKAEVIRLKSIIWASTELDNFWQTINSVVHYHPDLKGNGEVKATCSVVETLQSIASHSSVHRMTRDLHQSGY